MEHHKPTSTAHEAVLLTVAEAARRLAIGRTLAYQLIGSGRLESVRIGGARRVPADAIPTFIADLRGNADGVAA